MGQFKMDLVPLPQLLVDGITDDIMSVNLLENFGSVEDLHLDSIAILFRGPSIYGDIKRYEI